MYDDLVQGIQRLLDEVARDCLRAIVTRDMDVERMRRLAKFCFGCMNQKHELPRRIAERGLVEAAKVLKFMDETAAALADVISQSEEDHGDRSKTFGEGDSADS